MRTVLAELPGALRSGIAMVRNRGCNGVVSELDGPTHAYSGLAMLLGV